jgi:acyl-CoA synthetase (AMP-forming)/AMP-acid ligase II
VGYGTLHELLRDRAARDPHKLAVLFRDKRLDYAELERSANRAAHALERIGLRRGDRLALLLPNSVEFLVAVFAAARAGIVFVPVNTAFAPGEIEYVLAHSEAAGIVAAPAFVPAIDSMRDRLPRLGRFVCTGADEPPGWISWERLLHGADDSPLGSEAAAGDLASITYTSGTTDRPKGVMLSQYAYAFAPQARARALGWNETDRVFVVLPLFHVNALCHMAIAMLSVGGTLVLAERFSASRFWDEVREHEVTTSSLMRTIPQILLSLAERADDAKNPLRLVVSLLPPEAHLRFEERFGLVVVGSYSLTEDILSVIGPVEKERRKLGSCGLPVAPELHRIRIVGEDGRDLGPGEPGEIVKRSPALMRGYYKNPRATEEALRGGWLYTGDLGYLDEDGFLFFVDRKKDMVKRGDENISSEEVERVLNSHPMVAESAVVGVPDPIRQEEIKAYVVLKPPATVESVPPHEIWEFCARQLAAFKVPRYLEYRRELPKTPSSKIQKQLLRAAPAPEGPCFDREANGPRRG